MSLSVLNNFELCYRGTSFKVQGGSVIAAFFLAHNYVSEQFGNYVEYGICTLVSALKSKMAAISMETKRGKKIFFFSPYFLD